MVMSPGIQLQLTCQLHPRTLEHTVTPCLGPTEEPTLSSVSTKPHSLFPNPLAKNQSLTELRVKEQGLRTW